MQAVGTPPMLAAIALGQLSNVMGCLSTYGIGSAPPYYGAGYVPQSKWYQLGFLLSIFYIAVWLFAGGAWWKVSQCRPMQHPAPAAPCKAGPCYAILLCACGLSIS